MTTDLIDRLRVIRDKRTTTPADGRVINEAMTALTATPSAQAGEVVAWQPMETAPDDGTMLRLLVDFTEHSTEDNIRAVTIGAYAAEGDPAGAWQFAGWCWTQDHFTEGKGTPVGWMPLLGDNTPQPQGDASPQVSGGGEALTDDEVIERCEAAGLRWLEPDNVLPDGTIDLDGFPGSFDMVTMAEMRALFAALSTPQARPEGYDDGSGRIRDWREPAPTADGGVRS